MTPLSLCGRKKARMTDHQGFVWFLVCLIVILYLPVLALLVALS